MEFCLEFMEFCLEFMEFWWRSPTMVLVEVDADAALTELFTLVTPLLEAICIAAVCTEFWSPLEVWGTICWGGCDCCCNWSSDCCAWLWSPDEPLVLRGNLAKLSEKMQQKETFCYQYIITIKLFIKKQIPDFNFESLTKFFIVPSPWYIKSFVWDPCHHLVMVWHHLNSSSNIYQSLEWCHVIT